MLATDSANMDISSAEAVWVISSFVRKGNFRTSHNPNGTQVLRQSFLEVSSIQPHCKAAGSPPALLLQGFTPNTSEGQDHSEWPLLPSSLLFSTDYLNIMKERAAGGIHLGEMSSLKVSQSWFHAFIDDGVGLSPVTLYRCSGQHTVVSRPVGPCGSGISPRRRSLEQSPGSVRRGWAEKLRALWEPAEAVAGAPAASLCTWSVPGATENRRNAAC